eukprot:g10450.t1
MHRTLDVAVGRHLYALNRSIRRFAYVSQIRQTRMFSHASETYYKHPLSELVLDVLYENKPQWFDKDSVEWNGSDGTLKLPFSIDEQDGVIVTYYDLETKTHYLGLQFEGLVGKVSLTDNSKSAWQSNINDDRNRVIDSTKIMIEKIEDASNGILPPVGDGPDNTNDHDHPDSLHKSASGFHGPFSDSVPPVNG